MTTDIARTAISFGSSNIPIASPSKRLWRATASPKVKRDSLATLGAEADCSPALTVMTGFYSF